MKRGKGLYEQLPPEVMEKHYLELKRRMMMDPAERAKEIYDSIQRGMKMIDEALTEMIQDKNVEYINSL